MDNKFAQAVDAVIKKTEENKLVWERVGTEFYQNNPFFRKYIQDNYILLDGINNYMALYKEGYIYFNNSEGGGYREIAIQPKEGADVTVLSMGRVNSLEKLENAIKSKLDNPDEFINSLID